MPSVTIELTTELAGRMCNFVYTEMIGPWGAISAAHCAIPVPEAGDVSMGATSASKLEMKAAQCAALIAPYGLCEPPHRTRRLTTVNVCSLYVPASEKPLSSRPRMIIFEISQAERPGWK